MKHEESQTTTQVFINVYTVEDLHAFYRELELFLETLFQAGKTTDDALNASFDSQRKDAILAYFKENGVEKSDPVAIKDAVLKIKELAKQIPVITLKLGYDPTRNHLESFSTWFLTRIKKKVIFEILVERGLVGGAYITHNGLFKDYSVKGKLNELFEKNGYGLRK